jgi:prevent-host-death family protein
MAIPRASTNRRLVVSALHARANFGQLLRNIEKDGRGMVIEKRGRPRAILLSIRDYVRLAAPEPEILRTIGEESKRNGADLLTSAQIDHIIKKARAEKDQTNKRRVRKSRRKSKK